MLEGKVIRRYQSDGPRFDAEAIPIPSSSLDQGFHLPDPATGGST
jgi:hypothetical protein